MRRAFLGLLLCLFALPAAAQFEVNQLIGFGSGGPVTKISASTEWNGATASFTFSGDDLLNITQDKWVRTNDQLDSDFEIQWTMNTSSNGSYFFFYPVSADATWSSTAGASAPAGLGTTSGMFEFKATNPTTYALMVAGSSVTTGVYAANDVLKLVKSGTTVTFYKNGTLSHTFAATSSVSVRLSAGSSSFGPGIDVKDVSWTQ